MCTNGFSYLHSDIQKKKAEEQTANAESKKKKHNKNIQKKEKIKMALTRKKINCK